MVMTDKNAHSEIRTTSPGEVGRIQIHDGPAPEIPAAIAVAVAPASQYLYEWHEYRVCCPGAQWLEVGSERVTSFGPESGQFRVQFTNQLGLSRIRAFDDGGKVLDTCHVEVVSPKLGAPAQSLAFLKALVADLTSEQSTLAFLPRAPTSRTVRAVTRPPSLLVQYFFLLNSARGIEEAIDLILRTPHRVLDDESRHVSIFDLTEIDADVMVQLAQQGNTRWDRSTNPPRLTAAPEGVWFRVPQEGFDSAENRFVKAAAESLATACDAVLNASWLQGTENTGVVRRRDTLTRLRENLRRFARAPMFDEVGPMARLPVSSRVLQRRPGYRDLNTHWQAFLQSREPVWQRMQHAIDVRDIATLYEYWVWFALCREIQEVYGSERPLVSTIPPTELGLPHGLKAQFKGQGTLTYNASRKAYSRIWLRPDYLWEPASGANVAFDAKFRLAWDASPLDIEGETSKDPVARAKADDMIKMHAYRDAIPNLRSAVVLYPGTTAEFRSVNGEQVANLAVADVLMNEIDGVGAIPMSPLAGGENDE